MNIDEANAQLEAMRRKWQEDFEAEFGKRGEGIPHIFWDVMFSAWRAAAAFYSGR